jgi:hypothetical protein
MEDIINNENNDDSNPMDEYNNAVDVYYKLKGIYYTNYTKKKKEFQKNKKKGDVFFPKCINCERGVGSIFSTSYNSESDSRILIAICGDKQSPCGLNININVGYCNSVQEDLFEVETLLKNIKNEIIYDKNNAMFGYILKDKALKNFESFKNSISEYTDRLKLNVEQYDFIINNKNIKNELIKTEFEVNLYIDQIKDLVDNFSKTNNTQLVNDAVEIYQHTLKPKLKYLMDLKYKHNFVEFNESTKTYQLFQLPYSIETFERCYGNPKIISLNYNTGLNANQTTNKQPKNNNIKQKEKKPKIMTQKIKPIKQIKEKKTKTLKQNPTIVSEPTIIPEQNNNELIDDIFGEDSDEEELNSDQLKESEHTNSDF